MDEEQQKLVEELLFSGEHKPSFAKMLYFGAFDGNRVLPYPVLPENVLKENNAFIDKLNIFAEEQIDPDWIDRHAEIPDTVIKGLGKLGLLGMTIPSEYGGLGLPQYTYCRAMERLARRCASTALFVNAHQSIGLRAILLFGTEEQRKRWLPPLAAGDAVAAFSLTEPNAGSDAAGVETVAEYLPDQDAYKLNGKKQWTTNGSIADVLTVMAQSDVDTPEGPKKKITAFLVTPDLPGFKITNPGCEKVGMRGTKTTNLEFTDMIVPASAILGPKGGGLRVALTALDYGRTTFGATCTGTAKLCYEKAVQHATTRQQFKRPLSSFPLVQEKLATMAALVYAMDATTYLTAGLMDTGEDDIMIESAMLKVFASDSQWKVLYDAMQIFGGRSFFTDQPFERMMRDARLNMIGEGANEVMRAFIGAVGMRDVGMQLKEGVDALKNPFSNMGDLVKFGKRLTYRMKRPKVKLNSPLLRSEAQQLSRGVRKFGMAVLKMLGKYKEEVVEKQLDLDRMATAAMALYTSTAVLAKLDKDLESVNHKVNDLGSDVTVAKHYCKIAFKQIDDSLSNLFCKSDADVERVSEAVTLG